MTEPITEIHGILINELTVNENTFNMVIIINNIIESTIEILDALGQLILSWLEGSFQGV